MLCVSGFELYSCWVPLNTNQVGGGFHWQPAMFDNPADVKCCFSIFCTISVNERGDAKLLGVTFQIKSSQQHFPVSCCMYFLLCCIFYTLGGSHLLNSSVNEMLWCDCSNEPFEVPLKHTCQLFRIIWESPGYNTNLSCT